MIPEFNFKQLIRDVKRTGINSPQFYEFVVKGGVSSSLSSVDNFLNLEFTYPNFNLILAALHYVEARFDDYLVKVEMTGGDA